MKKWTILTIVFLVQVSMNFNTSLYSNAIKGIGEEFNVSAQAARLGAAIFLITYAFGCELWAPWSEEFGRRPVLQASMFLVNIWQLPVALPPNFATILIGRALGGLSTAGGSVTLGMVADVSTYWYRSPSKLLLIRLRRCSKPMISNTPWHTSSLVRSVAQSSDPSLVVL